MGDWIDDLFDQRERMAPLAVRLRLEHMLDHAVIVDRREQFHFEFEVMRDDLTTDQADELFRALGDRQRRIPDMYAPSQSQLARWMRMFVR